VDEEEAALPKNPPDRVEIRRAPDKQPILEASLVLSSQAVKHWIEFDGVQFILSLDPWDAARAREILNQYEAENEGFQIEAQEVPPLDLHVSPLLHLLIPVAVFFWAGSRPWSEWLMQRGGANARLILNGEWWRCLTAITLHVDHEHFLGNMLSGFFILNLLRRRCGPGTSMLLLTLAAGVTNFIVAAVSRQSHFSIGFSTVVFAALGLLAGIETLHLPRHRLGGLRSLSPLLAAFFLAVLVGIGEKADIKAHFIGFALGAMLSPLVPWLERRLGKPWRQIAGVTAVYTLYAGAWALAQR
jgi:membrane associated rhomboid family serine protease